MKSASTSLATNDRQAIADLSARNAHRAAASILDTERLLQVTEERCARERVLSESTDKIRRQSDVDRILQAAAEELARHLHATRVAVHISPQTRAETDRS